MINRCPGLSPAVELALMPKRMRYRLNALLPPLCSGSIILLAWCVLAYGRIVSPLFLPPPHKVAGSLFFLFGERAFLADIGASIWRITMGFLASVVVAVPLGIAMGAFSSLRKHVEPIVAAMRYIPAVALVPLCILWFGIGETQKIIVIVIGTFFQLTTLIAEQVLAVPQSYREVAYTLDASRFETILHVIFPAASPGVFDACRVSFGWAWTYLVVAEIVGASTGIGYKILESQRFLRIDQVFVGVLVIGLLGILADLGMLAIHRLLFPWAEKTSW